MKCEYCITAQVVLAKAAGASDDEIKGAIQIAAEVLVSQFCFTAMNLVRTN